MYTRTSRMLRWKELKAKVCWFVYTNTSTLNVNRFICTKEWKRRYSRKIQHVSDCFPYLYPLPAKSTLSLLSLFSLYSSLSPFFFTSFTSSFFLSFKMVHFFFGPLLDSRDGGYETERRLLWNNYAKGEERRKETLQGIKESLFVFH